MRLSTIYGFRCAFLVMPELHLKYRGWDLFGRQHSRREGRLKGLKRNNAEGCVSDYVRKEQALAPYLQLHRWAFVCS